MRQNGDRDLPIKICLHLPDTENRMYLSIRSKHEACNTPQNWLHLLQRRKCDLNDLKHFLSTKQQHTHTQTTTCDTTRTNFLSTGVCRCTSKTNALHSQSHYFVFAFHSTHKSTSILSVCCILLRHLQSYLFFPSCTHLFYYIIFMAVCFDPLDNR
jgi:hypothetical protein